MEEQKRDILKQQKKLQERISREVFDIKMYLEQKNRVLARHQAQEIALIQCKDDNPKAFQYKKRIGELQKQQEELLKVKLKTKPCKM